MPWKGLLGKKKEEDIDIETYLRDLSIREGRIIESDDITYVKPIDLDPDGKTISSVLRELERKNIVILNVRALMPNKIALKEMIKQLKDSAIDLDGDIARLSDEKIIVVPSGVRIVHKEE